MNNKRENCSLQKLLGNELSASHFRLLVCDAKTSMLQHSNTTHGKHLCILFVFHWLIQSTSGPSRHVSSNAPGAWALLHADGTPGLQQFRRNIRVGTGCVSATALSGTVLQVCRGAPRVDRPGRVVSCDGVPILVWRMMTFVSMDNNWAQIRSKTINKWHRSSWKDKWRHMLRCTMSKMQNWTTKLMMSFSA